MGDPVVRFEIGCRNRPTTSSFYETCFGWTIEDDGLSGDIRTGGGQGGGTGIDGALTALGHDPHQYVMVYIQIADIDAACKTLSSQGGAVKIGPIDIPGGKGRFAWFDDPEGNTLGLFEPPQ